MKRIYLTIFLFLGFFAFSQIRKHTFEIQPLKLSGIFDANQNLTKYVDIEVHENYELSASATLSFFDENNAQTTASLTINMDSDLKNGQTISDYDVWKTGLPNYPARSRELLAFLGKNYLLQKYGLNIVVVN